MVSDQEVEASILRAAAAIVQLRWPDQKEISDTILRDAYAINPTGPPEWVKDSEVDHDVQAE